MYFYIKTKEKKSVSYIYVCIYVIHRENVSLYRNSSVRLDTRDARSWDRNLADFYASWI